MVIKGPGEEFGPGSRWILGDSNGFAEVSLMAPSLKYKKNILYIENISIKKPLRGRGLGSLLYKKIEEFAYNIGVQHIQLDSEPNSVSFWLKMGFYKKDLINYKDKVAMAKSL
jgi:ribosomal protein S18 acetylase RimI-like enzyme